MDCVQILETIIPIEMQKVFFKLFLKLFDSYYMREAFPKPV